MYALVALDTLRSSCGFTTVKSVSPFVTLSPTFNSRLETVPVTEGLTEALLLSEILPVPETEAVIVNCWTACVA